MGAVLVIEGDWALRRVIEMELREQGHWVIAEADGAEGVERAVRARPDVVIVGPRPEGMPSARVIREVKRRSSASIVGITADDATPAAADAAVSLPLGLDLLLSLVSQAIEERLRSAGTG